VGSGVVLLTLLVLLVIVLAFASDLNPARPWINRTVSAALDRPFAINGDLRLHWVRDVANQHYRLPRPQISAADIVIGNPEWLTKEKKKPAEFGEIRSVIAVIDPLPLFGRTVVLPLLDIDAAHITLERRQDGRNNWTFGKEDNEPEDPKKQWRVAPGLLRMHDSWVQLEDAQRQLSTRVTADSYPQGIRWAIKGTLNKEPLQGNGMAGSLLALQDKTTPYPVALNLVAGDTHIEAKGTLTNPSQLAALNINLKISGTSMAQLYALTNIVLPETPPYSTDGHLIGELNEYGGTWRYEKFNGMVGGSDLHGTVEFKAREKTPLLTAQLVSQNLVLKDLAPLIGADSNESKERRKADVMQPDDKLLPVEPFKTDRWGSIDARVKFSGKRIIREAAVPIEDLELDLALTDSVLKLTPLRFGIAGGDLAANIKLDGRQQPMHADIDMKSRHLQLRELFPTTEAMKSSEGEVNGSAELKATGNSIASLAGSADGQMHLFIDRATVSKFLLEAAGLNIANVVVTKLFGDRQVKLNCAAADFNINDGVMKTDGFIVDTEEALIDINGDINLGDEKLGLKVKPQTKGLRILSLRAPLYVDGTFKDPDVSLDKGVLALRGGGAVALGAVALPAALVPLIATGNANLKDDNGCVAILQKSRDATAAQTSIR
jgi:uncharacterized protein involved in outer membrane biogenesis